MWRFIKTSQIVRGIGSAFAFLAFAPQYIPFATLDLAVGMHSVVVGWNSIATAIGKWLATLFSIPDIPPELVNAAIIGITVGPVWSYSILKKEWGTHKGIVQNWAFWTRIIIGLLDGFIFAFFVTIARPGPMLWITLAALVMVFITVLYRMPLYRRGFAFAIGFLIAVEGVYLFSTDAFQAKFEGFVCEHEQVSLERCRPDPTP